MNAVPVTNAGEPREGTDFRLKVVWEYMKEMAGNTSVGLRSEQYTLEVIPRETMWMNEIPEKI